MTWHRNPPLAAARSNSTKPSAQSWAVPIVYKENGEPALDQQCDHIREDARHGAARDLMQNSQLAGDMRPRDGDGQPIEAGTVVFAWRLTDGASEPFNIEFNSTGLIISMHPDAYMLERYRSGELTGPSINGSGGLQEELGNA